MGHAVPASHRELTGRFLLTQTQGMGSIPAPDCPDYSPEGQFRVLRLLCIAFLLLLCVGRADAAAINVGLLPEPVDLSTSPTLRLLAHGPSAKDTYRLTVELENTDASCTLQLDQATASRVTWLTFDEDAETSYPLKALRKRSTRVISSTQPVYTTTAGATPSVPVPPRTATEMDLDFGLPADGVPTEFALHARDLDLGCTTTLTLDSRAAVNARAALLAIEGEAASQ
jgi:hypothetical protein